MVSSYSSYINPSSDGSLPLFVYADSFIFHSIILQKCLVREPHERACIEDLLQHPFMAQSTCDTFDMLTAYNILPAQTTAEIANVRATVRD